MTTKRALLLPPRPPSRCGLSPVLAQMMSWAMRLPEWLPKLAEFPPITNCSRTPVLWQKS